MHISRQNVGEEVPAKSKQQQITAVIVHAAFSLSLKEPG
jgi:hypothetical protein